MGRKWGQHFLVKQRYVDKMIKHAMVQAGDRVLEIGPGHGVLTQMLLEQGAEVTALEVDPELIPNLNQRFAQTGRFTVHETDALDWLRKNQFPVGERPWKLVANLPYQIVSSLIVLLLPMRHHLALAVLMMQKEMAERLSAQTGDGKHYGPISIVAQLGFERQILFDVPPNAFNPPPKVDSQVMKFIPRTASINPEDEQPFLVFSRNLFQQRRKTFVNNVKKFYPDWFDAQDADFWNHFQMRRMETFSMDELMSLFALYKQFQTGQN